MGNHDNHATSGDDDAGGGLEGGATRSATANAPCEFVPDFHTLISHSEKPGPRSTNVWYVHDTLLLHAHHGQNSTTLPETTRLHDYDTTGNIKDNSDILHALLGSIEDHLATTQPSSCLPTQRLAPREL